MFQNQHILIDSMIVSGPQCIDYGILNGFFGNEKFFSSAPKEAQEVIRPREKELFYGARAIGWTLMVFVILMILGVGIIAIWDGFRSGYSFVQFFLRFVLIFTIYKAYDMICFDYFLLMKFHFFLILLSRGEERIPSEEVWL